MPWHPAVRQTLKGQAVVTVTEKTVVTQRLEGRCEPLERGGTNQGFTPTETLMASLVGCTNVITHKVAHKNGVDIRSMNIRLEAQFDRRGVTLQEEIERPFTSVTLHIDLETEADAAAVERVKRELAMFCPVSKVFRNAGIELKEIWNVRR
jgi:putative redox protein